MLPLPRMKPLLCLLIIVSTTALAALYDAPVPTIVGRFQLVPHAAKLYKIDTATGQVLILDKRVTSGLNGQVIEIEGWMPVLTIEEVEANVRAVLGK